MNRKGKREERKRIKMGRVGGWRDKGGNEQGNTEEKRMELEGLG